MDGEIKLGKLYYVRGSRRMGAEVSHIMKITSVGGSTPQQINGTLYGLKTHGFQETTKGNIYAMQIVGEVPPKKVEELRLKYHAFGDTFFG